MPAASDQAVGAEFHNREAVAVTREILPRQWARERNHLPMTSKQLFLAIIAMAVIFAVAMIHRKEARMQTELDRLQELVNVQLDAVERRGFERILEKRRYEEAMRFLEEQSAFPRRRLEDKERGR
jgi:cell division protein FtsL